MTPSIRKYLLIHLLLAITVFTAVTTTINYFYDQHTIENHLDDWLSQSAFTIQALISNDLDRQDLTKIQTALENIPNNVRRIFQLRHQNTSDVYAYRSKFQFQVWDKKGNIILHSPTTPKTLLSDGTVGFSKHIIDNQPWQVFTLFDKTTGLTIVTAERSTIRNELSNLITQEAIFILLISYPLLGLIIWFIVGRGLNTIRRIAKEVKNRAPNYLDPVDSQAVPNEVKPLVDELNRLFLRLQQGFEREKSFSANAAHELRTPLAALKTQAQVALRSLNNEERNLALQKVIASVDRSTHVVQQLLTLSRLVPEATLQDITRFNLSKLTTEVIANLVPTALEKNIEIELSGGEDNIYLLGNPTAISILIRNLVDNAIRYTPEGGKVNIFVEKIDSIIRLKVCDNGPGIPAEMRSRVFERFYRVLGTKIPGSGLGLAIVQQIASLHKATVTLGTPAVGHGLEVMVVFSDNLLGAK